MEKSRIWSQASVNHIVNLRYLRPIAQSIFLTSGASTIRIIRIGIPEAIDLHREGSPGDIKNWLVLRTFHHQMVDRNKLVWNFLWMFGSTLCRVNKQRKKDVSVNMYWPQLTSCFLTLFLNFIFVHFVYQLQVNNWPPSWPSDWPISGLKKRRRRGPHRSSPWTKRSDVFRAKSWGSTLIFALKKYFFFGHAKPWGVWFWDRLVLYIGDLFSWEGNKNHRNLLDFQPSRLILIWLKMGGGVLINPKKRFLYVALSLSNV